MVTKNNPSRDRMSPKVYNMGTVRKEALLSIPCPSATSANLHHNVPVQPDVPQVQQDRALCSVIAELLATK
ncbi:hypothetical protein Tco_0966915 [Tanacetum coccineum]